MTGFNLDSLSLPEATQNRKYAVNHILLRGRPGSGKSTALARLLLEESNSNSPLSKGGRGD